MPIKRIKNLVARVISRDELGRVRVVEFLPENEKVDLQEGSREFIIFQIDDAIWARVNASKKRPGVTYS